MDVRGIIIGFSLWFWLAGAGAAAASEGVDGDDLGRYPLDSVQRVVLPGAQLPCAETLVVRRGESLRYSKPVRVHPAFATRLAGFEQLVAEVATEFYGRAPRRIQHLGAYNCRRIRLYPDFVSEHALGNAIDIAGFDFGPLPRGATAPAELPKALRRGFSVRLERHWDGGRGPDAVHQHFLRALAQRLIDRTDLFRVVLGPAWPGHKNHFHLDCAPYRMIEVF